MTDTVLHVIIRLPEVMKRTGKSRASIYSDMKRGEFPDSIPIGKRAVGWLEADINEWILGKRGKSFNGN